MPTHIYAYPPFEQTCSQSDLHTALRVALTEPLAAEQAHLSSSSSSSSGSSAAAAPEPVPAFVTPERLERLRRAIQRRGGEAAIAAGGRCV